ncbi:hypothetical protein BYT27DRAFT_7183903 [Phlegmacium glaucopus]|nr:hypothetical protein BYT27DRAFT_7183903 [Phlegmacium glaucopus]
MSHRRRSKVPNAALPIAGCLQALASHDLTAWLHLLSVCRVDTVTIRESGCAFAGSRRYINMKMTRPIFEALVAPPGQTH